MGGLWRAWVMAVIGAWFFVSGWLFDLQVTEFSVFGGMTLLIALWIIMDHPAIHPWRSWALVVMSAWLAVMPWAVPFAASALAVYVTAAAGTIGVILSVWMAAAAEPRRR